MFPPTPTPANHQAMGRTSETTLRARDPWRMWGERGAQGVRDDKGSCGAGLSYEVGSFLEAGGWGVSLPCLFIPRITSCTLALWGHPSPIKAHYLDPSCDLFLSHDFRAPVTQVSPHHTNFTSFVLKGVSAPHVTQRAPFVSAVIGEWTWVGVQESQRSSES